MTSDSEKSSERQPKVLVLSAGGSPAPLIESISRQRPKYLVFFVSVQTKGIVEDSILPELPTDYRYLGLEYIETPSAQLLDESYEVIREELPGILLRWGIEPSEARADFTGGTKVMSAALVLALAAEGSDFSYVGAEDVTARDKGGVGVVLNGKEWLFLRANPWQRIVSDKVREASRAFAEGHYEVAYLLLPDSPPRTRTGALASSLRGIFEAYFRWDRFQHDLASKLFEANLDSFRSFTLGTRDERYLAFLESTDLCVDRLKEVQKELGRFKAFQRAPGKVKFDGLDGRAIPADLCAAAIRRARVEEDPEDGVMLLYAAVEKMARGRLIALHGIDNSKCPVERLGSLREEILAFGGDEEGTVKLPLNQSYRLLGELGDDLGAHFSERFDFLQKLMASRNYCWREHGTNVVSREAFEKLLPGALDFLGFDEEELTRFPTPRGW